MISDVLGAAGPTWLSILVTIAAIVAFFGIIVWVVRMNKQQVLAMSRLPLEDAGDDLHEGGDYGELQG